MLHVFKHNEIVKNAAHITLDGIYCIDQCINVGTVPACSWRAFSREDMDVRHSWSSGEGMRPAGVVGATPHNLDCHQLESSLFIICKEIK